MILNNILTYLLIALQFVPKRCYTCYSSRLNLLQSATMTLPATVATGATIL